jgi:hypothetical protein
MNPVTIRTRRTPALCALTAALATSLVTTTVGSVLDVRLGETIERSWEDVAKAGNAYGPKQAFDAVSKETHIWLPYGSQGVYYETYGLRMSDPGRDGGTGTPLAVTRDGNQSGRLAYKLRFDKPIGAFRVGAGWSEWGVGGTSVGGAEYSADGREWKSLREITVGGIVEPLLDPAQTKVDSLHTRELYLRFYTRDKSNPAAEFGPGRWMKLRLAGDPDWGDHVETFDRSQIQLWVTPSDRPGDAPVTDEAAVDVPTAVRSEEPPLDHAGPWGIASGAEWSGDHPRFNPMLKDAGVRWLRYFPEWQTIQPRKGEWDWTQSDRLVADARANGIRLSGAWAYFAPWASADGGTRRGPIRDIQYWRDYVSATVARYRNDIEHWEVWNEFNGSFYAGVDKPKEYAELVIAAHEAARKANPGAKVGMGCANFDVGFLDAAIKAGAAGCFDFLAVHPYENLGAVMRGGGEQAYLSMASSLRKMLAANGQPTDMPLMITETGFQAPVEPDAEKDALQAEALVKVYVLSLAQGFERVFWFEARGPAYGHGTDHGIIRKDWTERPAHRAMKTMTGLLGAEPKYLGWLKLDTSGYGFAFEGADGPVLVAWSPADAANAATFGAPVRVVTLAGEQTAIEVGKPIALTRMPVFLVGLPTEPVALARSQAGQPFPWGTDYGTVREVSCRLGGVNDEKGIQQTGLQTTAVVNDLTDSWRRTDFSHGGEGRYVYFRVDPTFASFGTRDLEITVVARRSEARMRG